MKFGSTRILKYTTQTLVALPLLSAVAGLILAPTVLHPFRRLSKSLKPIESSPASTLLAKILRFVQTMEFC
jgi:hypothetical protein